MPLTSPTLHYIYDPLCGWCYGAAPLLEAAHRLGTLRIVLHGGGMLAGSKRRRVTPAFRDFVIPIDQRIHRLTGQPFGPDYIDGLLCDSDAVLDSAPPITAILAAEEINGSGIEMLHRLQHAHYVEGLRISDFPVLQAISQEQGLPGAQFLLVYTNIDLRTTRQHIRASRRLLTTVGGTGFPAFVLESPQGEYSQLDSGPFLGRVDAWTEHLMAKLAVGLPSPDGQMSLSN